MLSRSVLLVLCVLGACAGQAACSTPAEPARCEDGHVEKLKELVVVEESVLTDARAKNATAGPWSFRHAMENMTPAGGDARAFVRDWLESWGGQTEVNGFPLDEPESVGLRSQEMNKQILCPWLHETPANACDATCGTCATRTLDLAKSPFRLIAITNRVDLREQVPAEAFGESRLVFGLTKGPADDAASTPLAMTVIVEYSLPPSRSLKEWATAWHDLGRFDSFDEPYRAALENVTNGFTKRGSNPAGLNGSALGQVRTNENALNWIWQLREFGLTTQGLRLQPVRNTPPAELNDSTVLRDYLSSHAAEIRSNKYELPVSLRSGSANVFRFSWQAAGVDEPTRRAFEGGTCNGCHGTAKSPVDTAFHVSPYRTGVAKLSPFMFDPKGGPDDVTARAASMMRAVCSP